MNIFKKFQNNYGFTLIELLVVLAIISLLAMITLYSAMQYINKGKDATVKGNLAILVSAGELWYDKNNSSYVGFCGSATVLRSLSQVPSVDADKHCYVKPSNTAWATCAREFVDNTKAYCVDSKGNQREIDNINCTSTIMNCCFGVVNVNCIP